MFAPLSVDNLPGVESLPPTRHHYYDNRLFLA